MIAFWRVFFAQWDSAAPGRQVIEPRHRNRRPFPGAAWIAWALGLVLAFALTGLPTPGAAQTFTCSATSAATDALSGEPVFGP